MQPKIRFKGYKDDWKTYKVSKVLERVKEPVKVVDNATYREIGIRSHGRGIFYKVPVLGKGLGNKSVFWVAPNVFVVNIVFAWERAVARTTENEVGMIASHRFPMFKPRADLLDLDFITRYFVTHKGKYLLELASPGGAGRNKTLGQKEFENLQINIPTKDEQQKITSLFNLLDKRSDKQQEKIEQLELFKKGVMQKIFSQDIRFKDENGQDFPEWDTVALNDLGSYIKNYSYSRSMEGDGEYHHIHYGDIHSKFNGIIDEKTELPTLSIKEGNTPFTLLRNGDVIFADASEDTSDLGKTVVLKEVSGRGILGGLHTHCFRPNNNLDSMFLHFFTQTSDYRKFIKINANGVSVFGLSKPALFSLEIPLPSIKEQVRISDFLYRLTQKIGLLKQKESELKLMKKSLLNQMFV